MTKDFSNNLEGFIRLVLLLLSFNCFSQVLPSTIGVHHKKEASFPEQSITLDFDGVNDKVTTNSNLDNLSGFTIELWVNADKISVGRAIIGEDNLIECAFSGKNKIRIWVDGNVSSPYYIVASINRSLFLNSWNHIAFVGNASSSPHLKIYVNGELKSYGGSNPGLNFGKGSNNKVIKIAKDVGSSSDNYFNGSMDEIRIWNDTRTTNEINDNMFKHLNGDESNLMIYYQMSDGSGNTLTDNSSNSNNGTLKHMNNNAWVTSYVPLADLPSAYQNDIEGLWKAVGTGDSDESDGLSLSVDEALSNDFIIFGNNDDDNGTSSSSILDLNLISDRVWYFEEVGDITTDVKIDISIATGYSGEETLIANNYKLLYKTCAMCDYSDISDGLSKSVNGTDITFNSVNIKDGYYTIGSTDSNL